MQRTHRWSSIALAAFLACAAPFALAQTNPSQPEHPKSGAVTHTPPFRSPPPQDQSHSQTRNTKPTTMPPRVPLTNHEMGQHDEHGTVKSVGKDGIVEVRTDAGLLTLHFPDAGQHLKQGEQITLHLSYTVDASSPKSPR